MSTHAAPSNATRTARVTVVDSVGCHFCADAQRAIDDLGSEYALSVRHVAMASPEGMDLMQQHGAGMSPLVLVDGTFISAGRLSRGRMRDALDAGGYRTIGGAA